MRRIIAVLSDSGMLGVPCITLRENTEWMETLEGGWNVLVGADKNNIIRAVNLSDPDIIKRVFLLKVPVKKLSLR